jgi:hypothetical protein
MTVYLDADTFGTRENFVPPEPVQDLPPIRFAFRPQGFAVLETPKTSWIRSEVATYLDFEIGECGEGGRLRFLSERRDDIAEYATESLYLLHICGMLDEPTEQIRSAIDTFERLEKCGHPRVSKAPKRHDLLLSEWLRREIPPRDFLLGNIMSTTSRWIVYGETGVGKTLFAMDMAGATAAGEGFLHWDGSGKRRRVMYLDGELPAETFKERLQIMAQRYGDDLELYAYNRDVLSDGEMPPLNTPTGEKWLWREIDAVKPDVIVSDSIMCLLEGSMSEEESWAPIKAMIRKISGRRIAQIWLHHTGHDTSKGFGTKTREWEMDTVLSLTKDAQNDEHLLMEFKKARLRTPDTRSQFEPLKITCGAEGWEIVGGVDKRRGPKGDRGDARARAFLEAYDRLAFSAPNSAGFNGKPVKKVALDAIRKEMRSRGALGDSTPGVIMTSGEYKAFDRAKEANTDGKKLIEADGMVWR